MKEIKKPTFDSEKERTRKVKKKVSKTTRKVDKKKIKPKEPKPTKGIEILPEEMIEYGAIEDGQRMAELYRVEWAVRYPQLAPYNYLKNVKLFTEKQARSFLTTMPAKEWYDFKTNLQNDMTKKVLDRHVDMIAEMQDKYIKSGALAHARILEMLNNNGIPRTDKDGNIKKDEDGKPIYQPLRSIDMLNLVNAMKGTFEIYRKAMGFNENEGMTQVLERIQLTQVNIHEAKAGEKVFDPETGEELVVDEGPASKVTTFLEELSYDDIKAMVKRARELNRNAKDEEET